MSNVPSMSIRGREAVPPMTGRPAAEAPLVVSVSPVRKLWIAWRASGGVEHVEHAEHVDPRA